MKSIRTQYGIAPAIVVSVGFLAAMTLEFIIPIPGSVVVTVFGWNHPAVIMLIGIFSNAQLFQIGDAAG